MSSGDDSRSPRAASLMPLPKEVTHIMVGTARLSRVECWSVTMMLGLQTVLLVLIAATTSPTMDEPAHLASGLVHWQSGTIDSYKVNPPLVRLIATSPLVLAGRSVEFATASTTVMRTEFVLGEQWLLIRRAESVADMVIARVACIPVILVGSIVVFWWARKLYGPAAGLVALALWCFSPNILGHGALMTPDGAAASMGLLACCVYSRWLRTPRWSLTLASGWCLGLALLTKSTWIVLLGLFPLMTCFHDVFLAGSQRPVLRRKGVLVRTSQQLVMLAAGLFVLASGYGYEGCFRKLGDYEFVSAALTRENEEPESDKVNRFRGTWLEDVPVPFPAAFLEGIDLQKVDFEKKTPAFLAGRWGEQGWWYYYLYATAVKVPLGTWGLFVIAVASTCVGAWRGLRADEFVMLIPAATIFILVSSQTGLNHHMRYVLPSFPLIFVFIGRVGQREYLRPVGVRWTVLGLLAATVVSSLATVPHSLAYFNEASGGPLRGHEHLVDSNIDWGQDLLQLKRWLHRRPDATPFFLAYWGPVEPSLLGIEYETVPDLSVVATRVHHGRIEERTLQPGWYAVSVNVLRGHPLTPALARTIQARWLRRSDPANAAYFLALKPAARAGYSILIFHVTDEDSQRLSEFLSRARP